MARRLVEKGVRFVQLLNGAYQTGGEGVSNWDGKKDLEDHYLLSLILTCQKLSKYMFRYTTFLLMDLLSLLCLVWLPMATAQAGMITLMQ